MKRKCAFLLELVNNMMRKKGKPQRLDLRNGLHSHVKKRSAASKVRDPFKGLAAMQRKKKRRDNVGAAKKRRIDNESMT